MNNNIDNDDDNNSMLGETQTPHPSTIATMKACSFSSDSNQPITSPYHILRFRLVASYRTPVWSQQDPKTFAPKRWDT